MVEGKDTAQGIVVGGIGGTVVGTVLGLLLAGKPAEAAPPKAQWDYLIECQLAIIVLLERLITAVEGIAPGVPPGIEVTVLTPWVAKEPEEIFSQAILSTGTFNSDRMVNWTQGKRLLIKVESSLNQAVQVQLIGNITDTQNLATNIDGPLPCAANSNISIGPAWDDWHPYIGVRITVAVAPTAGILTISAVIQE